MRLWTIQPIEVYEQLKINGVFHADPKRSDLLAFSGFQRAYEWLVNQMETIVGPKPGDVKSPIWAWHTWDWNHRKPDLRRSEFNMFYGDMVCMELEISDDRVLLSDEEYWHHVLSDTYISSELTEDEYDEESVWYDQLPNHEQEQLKRESWKKIFDVVPFDNGWFWKGRYVQATFWELKLDQVMDVRHFKGRAKVDK